MKKLLRNIAIDAVWWALILSGLIYANERLIDVAIFASWAIGAIILIGSLMIFSIDKEKLKEVAGKHQPSTKLHQSYGWLSICAETGFLVYLGFTGVASFYLLASLLGKVAIGRVNAVKEQSQ